MIDQTAGIAAATIFQDRHTAYRFTAEPVTDEQLRQVYALAKFTPTALNSQPLRITFVRRATAKERLLPLVKEINRAKSESAPVIAILAADTAFHEHLPVLSPEATGAKERLAANDQHRVAMAINNAWLQAGGFILAVRAVGLDAGPLGGINVGGIDEEFFPGTPLRTIMVVNIGHVAEGGILPRNPRLGFDEAVTLA